MESNNGVSNAEEIREYCDQLLKENEKEGKSPKETLALQRRVNVILSALGDEMPFLTCQDEFVEFKLLQENTAEKLFDMEKDLYEYGNDAGLNIFRAAITELFKVEKEDLLEMEKKGAVFFNSFRDDYLLTYGESLFEDVAEYLQEQGVPSPPVLLHNVHGVCYSNTLYPLYTFLYEDASKERKRAIQSILQQHGITVKDLKKCSRVKSK